ncbi:S24 family peptidase [Prevotella sp. oral taxon 299]|uniref:S24 family peptidase n=1 Tax=Prevotella sp. oral taxon 299 TaxID=652716 RepID=UPI0018DC4F2B|nr:S24 family peptidase [Prevotella sp. oral taxon 299]
MKEFESLADLSTGYITSMRKSFGEQKLSNVLKAFPELNRDWLLYGEGEMLKSTSTEDNNASFVAPYIKDELIYLPLFSVPALASFADNLSQASATLETYPVYVAKGEAYTKERHIVIEAKGESMSPTIQNKAMILCEKIEPEQWDYIQNEKIIAIIYDNSFTIKRVLRNNLATANTITLSADNTKYGTLEVSRCDIKGIYRAIKKVSEYL